MRSLILIIFLYIMLYKILNKTLEKPEKSMRSLILLIFLYIISHTTLIKTLIEKTKSSYINEIPNSTYISLHYFTYNPSYKNNLKKVFIHQ